MRAMSGKPYSRYWLTLTLKMEAVMFFQNVSKQGTISQKIVLLILLRHVKKFYEPLELRISNYKGNIKQISGFPSRT
jgi:hypothetical protein